VKAARAGLHRAEMSLDEETRARSQHARAISSRWSTTDGAAERELLSAQAEVQGQARRSRTCATRCWHRQLGDARCRAHGGGRALASSVAANWT